MKLVFKVLGAFFFSSLAYAQPPAAGNIVAHWTFDRDWSVQVKDSSANKYHGTSYEISHKYLPAGRYAVFNSPLDEIHIPEKGIVPPNEISSLDKGSISVWFNYQSVAGGQMLPIFYFGEKDTGTRHNSLIIEIGHGHRIENRKLYFTIVNRRFCYDTRVNLKEKQWYHFVAVVSDTGNTGYLDGKPLYNRNYNLGSDSTYTNFFSSVDSAEMLSIGYGRYGQEDPFFHFKGGIDDVIIYNRALNEEEVRSLYQYGRNKIFGIEPDLQDMPYGPYGRNILDFWKADSDEPTPVVVYIHGGGFVSNDKTSIRTSSGMANIRKCLANGVSFAAINYRYTTSTRLDTVLFDCARAVQYLRSKHSEWNIDPNRIAAYGGSAGGGHPSGWQ